MWVIRIGKRGDSRDSYRRRVAECLDRLSAEGHADIVEFPGYRGESHIWAKGHRRIPMLVRMHVFTAWVDTNWKDNVCATRRMQKRFETEELLAADRITLAAEHLRVAVVNRLPKTSTVTTVYNSIDTQKWSASSNASADGIGPNDIVFAGSLTGVFALLLFLTPLLHLQWHWGHLWSLIYAQNIVFNIDPSLQKVVPYVAIGHFWSLAVEEQFYMLWPLTLWLVRDRRQMIRLCLGGVIAANLMRLGLWHWLPASEASDWIYKELPTHIDGLLLGACAVLAIRERSVEDILCRTRLPFYVALAVLLAVCVSARGLDYRSYQMSTIGYTAVAVVFAGLLLRALILGSLLSRFFSGRILRFFGRYSYGMYVYHYLFNPALVTMRTWLQAQLHIRILGGILAAAITFALSTCAAVASYHLFESRFLKLERFLSSYIQRSGIGVSCSWRFLREDTNRCHEHIRMICGASFCRHTKGPGSAWNSWLSSLVSATVLQRRFDGNS